MKDGCRKLHALWGLNFASQYKEAEQNPSHLLISRRENSATHCFSRGSPCLLRHLQKAALGTLQLQNSHLLLSCLPLSLQNWVLLPGYASTPLFQSLVKLHKGKSPFCELVLPQLDPQDRQRLNPRKKINLLPVGAGFSLILHQVSADITYNATYTVSSWRWKNIPDPSVMIVCQVTICKCLLKECSSIHFLNHPFITPENKCYQSLTSKQGHSSLFKTNMPTQ